MPMTPLAVVLNGPAVAGWAAWLQDRLGPAFRCSEVDEATPAASRQARLAEAQVLITVGFDRRVAVGPDLRLVQVPGIGVDAVDMAALPPEVTLCNVGRHEGAVAEYVILQLLEWRHRTHDAESLLRRGDWSRSSRMGAAPHGELAGARIGIVGYGAIGRALVQRLQPFEVEIMVANRTPLPIGDGVAATLPLTEVDELLKAVDIAVLAIAATPETTGLIDRRRLALLGRSGLLVNVARAALVDEQALFESLRDGLLGGAVLDVWYGYPDAAHPAAPPSRLPFHTLPNVVMTPHMAGWTSGTVERRWTDIIANLERLKRGEPMANVVKEASAS
jgi:phosphoglycerate dehydrogenase-like enzyme